MLFKSTSLRSVESSLIPCGGEAQANNSLYLVSLRALESCCLYFCSAVKLFPLKGSLLHGYCMWPLFNAARWGVQTIASPPRVSTQRQFSWQLIMQAVLTELKVLSWGGNRGAGRQCSVTTLVVIVLSALTASRTQRRPLADQRRTTESLTCTTSRHGPSVLRKHRETAAFILCSIFHSHTL